MKKSITMLLLGMMAFFAIIFAAEPTSTTVTGVSRSQLLYNLTTPQYLSIAAPALTTEDTLQTLRSIFPKPVIKKVYVLVTDTVESQGDSVYFKLFMGGTKILDQKTSAFKLPGAYAFDPLVYTVSANSTLYIAAANTTSGQTSGITEGTYKVIIEYLNP